MEKNKGFTLIEMLVVVAMIGILSALLLISLGPSRNKAKDTRIISDVNQIRALAETYYDQATGYYNDAALRSAVTSIMTDIQNQGSTGGVEPGVHSFSNDVAVWAKLLSQTPTTYYCVDTRGNTVYQTSTVDSHCGTCDSKTSCVW